MLVLLFTRALSMLRMCFVLYISTFVNFCHAQLHHHYISPLTNALRIGNDFDGSPYYLCHATLFNTVLPGKTREGRGFCHVPYNGNEYLIKQFKIPARQSFGPVSWNRTTVGAIVVGRDIEGKPLFLCQTFFNGSLQPGLTGPNYQHCTIAIKGRAIITNNYRILSRMSEQFIGNHPAANIHYHQAPISINKGYR